MSNPFYFKQFTIHQDRCAMKIGTDGVLLGAWTSLGHTPNTILDVGTGTGVIALMLAQRSHAGQIDAVEVNADAYEQCVGNFEASSWDDRLFCYHVSFQEFAGEMDESYDLIVSNPPYFSSWESALPPNRDATGEGDLSNARRTARSRESLSFDQLIKGVSNLLSPDGRFAVVLPFDEEDHFKGIALHHGLHPQRITHVKGTSKASAKRSLMEFTQNPSEVIVNELVIETRRHVYTREYINLTKAFYLKM